MTAKRQLEYSRAAGDDLESIKRYIEADNPKAAARVLEYITDAADGLLDFPMTGKPWRRPGSRKLILTKYHYSVIYRVFDRSVSDKKSDTTSQVLLFIEAQPI